MGFRRVVAVATALVLALGACGSGDDREDAAGPAGTEAGGVVRAEVRGDRRAEAGPDPVHVAYFGGAPVINSNSDSGQFSSAFSIGGPLGIKYLTARIGPLLTKALPTT